MSFTYLKVNSDKCLCLLPVVLGLLFWSWSCKQRSWSWFCYFGLVILILFLVLVLRIWSCLRHCTLLPNSENELRTNLGLNYYLRKICCHTTFGKLTVHLYHSHCYKFSQFTKPDHPTGLPNNGLLTVVHVKRCLSMPCTSMFESLDQPTSKMECILWCRDKFGQMSVLTPFM